MTGFAFDIEGGTDVFGDPDSFFNGKNLYINSLPS
jgi:hypothetical protein